MKPEEIIKIIVSKSGKEIVLRHPTLNDLDELLKYINTLSREDTFITMSGEQITLDQERDWLQGTLEKLENDDVAHIAAFDADTLVGTTAIERDMQGKKRTRHVGTLGLSVKKEYRNDGIGYHLLTNVLEVAKAEMAITIAKLSVYKPNDKAQALYRKVGFEEYGRLTGGVYFHDEYVDEILMWRKV